MTSYTYIHLYLYLFYAIGIMAYILTFPFHSTRHLEIFLTSENILGNRVLKLYSTLCHSLTFFKLVTMVATDFSLSQIPVYIQFLIILVCVYLLMINSWKLYH